MPHHLQMCFSAKKHLQQIDLRLQFLHAQGSRPSGWEGRALREAEQLLSSLDQMLTTRTQIITPLKVPQHKKK